MAKLIDNEVNAGIGCCFSCTLVIFFIAILGFLVYALVFGAAS